MAVAFFGLAIYLLARSAVSLLIPTVVFYRRFGFHSVIEEFYLHRFLLFSLLPFGFNLAFGLFFGWRTQRYAPAGDSREAPRSSARPALLNPGLIALLVWGFLFNLPVFLMGGSWRVPTSWLPEPLYGPVSNELMLFFPMGNRGLLAGFFAAMAWERLAPLVGTHRRPGSGAPVG